MPIMLYFVALATAKNNAKARDELDPSAGASHHAGKQPSTWDEASCPVTTCQSKGKFVGILIAAAILATA